MKDSFLNKKNLPICKIVSLNKYYLNLIYFFQQNDMVWAYCAVLAYK